MFSDKQMGMREDYRRILFVEWCVCYVCWQNIVEGNWKKIFKGFMKDMLYFFFFVR